jgi:protein-histidine pros-kinase
MLPDKIFKAVVEALPDAVVIANQAGTIELVNGQAEALFGYERDELLAQPVEILVPDEFRDAHIGHRDQYVRHPGTRPMGVGVELLGRRKNGQMFPVEISLSPLVRGTDTYITSVIRDLSERNHMRNQLEMEQERQRIAMDLHDGTIQSIYATALALELALGDIVQDPVVAGKRVDSSITQLNGVIGDIRAYIFDLRPVHCSGDLLHDLAATIDEFRASTQLQVSPQLPPSISELRDDRAAAMLHITREALSNIRKHARASAIAVAVVDLDQAIHLQVQDDGVGFQAAALQGQTHRGLRNMRLRTQRLGGAFDLESAPGAGTTLRVRMPTGL